MSRLSLPEPIPGLVIRYRCLWYSEHLKGIEEGQKDRPCAIIAAIKKDDQSTTRVLVLPITHSPPDHPSLALEIPANTKRRLNLDDAQSWVVLSEWNEFIWPGPDLRRLPGADDMTVVHGVLPSRLFASIKDRFLALVHSRVVHDVKRT